MDYYSILGVNRNASQEEIKKAYRKLSMKHHPDRGGDEVQFKQINEAYDTLGDAEKKRMYDMGVNPNRQQHGGFQQSGPFEFRFDTGNFEDLFGGGFGFGRRPARNKSVNISVTIDYEDLIFGKTVHAEVTMPGNKRKLVTIDIPKGIEDGQHIRYQGMGDDTLAGVPPGDLIVNIRVVPHPRFRRIDDNLICEKEVSIWDCILGTVVEIDTVDRKKLNITVPPGTQPDTTLRVTGEGVPNVRSHRRGNLLIRIKTSIPKNLTAEQKQKIEDLKRQF